MDISDTEVACRLAARDAVNGVGDGRFNLEGLVTRADFIRDAWFYSFIPFAQKMSLTQGKEDGSFGDKRPAHQLGYRRSSLR
jgi:hypothetical protein